MGYTTSFEGTLLITPALSPEDWAVYRVNYQRSCGSGAPDSYCQWEVPGDATDTLRWDGGEKFYLWDEWLTHLVERFFGPRGYVLNGVISWNGEDELDMGRIIAKNNTLSFINLTAHRSRRMRSKCVSVR